MSLKAFHIVFITASSALAIGSGVWSLNNALSDAGTRWDWVFGIGSLAAGVALIFYGRYFLKKLKKVGYL
ncbi:MAG: hypothetical protein HY298_12160 [Verrucomicrobia bacterium]|nr:hypothetical protein [Verrucomicrobiota bacterium]